MPGHVSQCTSISVHKNSPRYGMSSMRYPEWISKDIIAGHYAQKIRWFLTFTNTTHPVHEPYNKTGPLNCIIPRLLAGHNIFK